MTSNTIAQDSFAKKGPHRQFASSEEIWPSVGVDAASVPSCEIAFTVVDADTYQTKVMAVGLDGRGFDKASPLGLSRGLAKRVRLFGTQRCILEQLQAHLRSFAPSDVLILAPHNFECDEVPLVIKDKVGPKTIARTREFFPLKDGPALLLLDIDGAPAEILELIETSGGLSSVLAKAFPGFANAACLTRPSSSAGIRNLRTNERSDTQNKEHRFYIVADGKDGVEFPKRLFDRLALAGFGYIAIGGSGSLLRRNIFDLSASNDSTRLVYEANAILHGDQLEHVPGARDGAVFGEGFLHTQELPPLTEDERRRLDKIWADLEAAKRPDAERQHAVWWRDQLHELKERGEPDEKARRTIEAAESNTLSGAFAIHLDDGRVVTVREIMANKAAFNGKTCADPIEPEYGGGRNKAKIYTDGAPNIRSQAHGGITYWLLREPEDYFSKEDTPPSEPLKPEADEAVAKGIRPTLYPFPDRTKLPRRDWRYGRFYERGLASLTVAPSGIGKSSLSIVEALAMATGKPLLGRDKPHGKSRVWLWNGEDPRDELYRKIEAAMLEYVLTPEDVGDRLLVDNGFEMPIQLAAASKSGPRIDEPMAQAITKAIVENQVDVLIIDPFVALHTLSENDNGAMDLLSKRIARIAHDGKCALGLVHHSRKTNGEETTIEDSRGASALLAAVRGARALTRMTPNEGLANGITDYWRYFRLGGVAKTSRSSQTGPGTENAEWMTIKDVALGNEGDETFSDAAGGQGAGVVVLWNGAPSAGTHAEQEKLPDILAEVRKAPRRSNVQSDDWVGFAVASVLGLDPSPTGDRVAIRGMVTRLIKAGHLRVISGSDKKGRPRNFVEAVGSGDSGPPDDISQRSAPKSATIFD